MIGGTTTFAIPTVQPLQSVFDVGGQSVTENYGRIVFSSTQAVANISLAATGATGWPMPTGSNLTTYSAISGGCCQNQRSL